MTCGVMVQLFLLLIPAQSNSEEARSNLFPANSKDQIGYINVNGEVMIPHRFEDGQEFSEGMAAVLIDGKWGYINGGGDIVITPAYWRVGSFSEGMAWVQIGRKYGYVNKNGELVVGLKYDKAGPFSEGLAVVEIRRDKNFFIDPAGRPAITPEVHLIDISGFSEGLVFAYTNKDSSPVYLDKTGQVAISLEKDRAGWVVRGAPFSDGLAAVQIKGKWGYINKAGEFVVKPQYERAAPFSEGLACVSTMEMKDHVGHPSYFIIDRTGAEVIRGLSWPSAGRFSEGLLPVTTSHKRNNTYMRVRGYIDTRGEMVIQPQRFAEAGPFRQGLARVKLHGRDTYINRKGQSVWVGELRRNDPITSYSGRSTLDIFLQALRDGNKYVMLPYILRMSRQELVEGSLKTLAWLLEDPKRTETTDAPRDAVIGMVAIAPFFETYSRSFLAEEKPIDPTPFRRMLTDKSLDIGFRRSLAQCYADGDFYRSSWAELDEDVTVLCEIVGDSGEDEELRGEATRAVSSLISRLYFKHRHDGLKEDLPEGGEKGGNPDIVAMLSRTTCPFTPQQKVRWETLVRSREKGISSALRLYREALGEGVKRSAYGFLARGSEWNLVADKTLLDKIDEIRREREKSKKSP